jgi:hypothetical protein
LNFGASITRVARLELNRNAFAGKTLVLLPKWIDQIDTIIATLEKEPSTLRLTYFASAGEGKAIIHGRVNAFQRLLAERWDQGANRYKLPIEVQIISPSGVLQ